MRTTLHFSLPLAFIFATACCLSTAQTPIGSITITGAEQQSGGVWDTGTVTAIFNGVSVSYSYGQFSTPAAVASALGALISQDCSMPVYAQANGATLNFYANGSNTITSASITATSDNPGGLFANASFALNGLSSFSPPQITNLSLPEGPPNMGFTIYGTNFGSAQGTVMIGILPATVLSWYASSSGNCAQPASDCITVQVPQSAPTGTYSILVQTPSWSLNIGQLYQFQVDSPFGCN